MKTTTEMRLVPVEDLVPYVNNARTHSPEQIAKLRSSLREFGFVNPLIIDRQNNIIAGHGRLEAAKKERYTEVPCVYVDDLTETQKKAYILADNRMALDAGWDADLLKLELQELQAADFDLGLTGFDLAEIDTYTQAEEEAPSDLQDDEDDIEAPERVTAGDVWQMGEHRLICGDSTDAATLAQLMQGETADVVFTDPPYGMGKESSGVANDNKTGDDLLAFNRAWVPLSFDFLKDTGGWYCWGLDEPLFDIYAGIIKPMIKEKRATFRNFITWAKHSARGVNSADRLSYPSETEKCLFVMKGADWYNNTTDEFNDKCAALLDYLRGQAKAAGLTQNKVKEVCGVSMYSHWFTRSQFLIIPAEHYAELQQACPGYFLKPYSELEQLAADIRPYFDSTQIDDVGEIGLTDVWRFPQADNDERAESKHATPKPIALCARGIHASTRPGEIVLDVFGGSGSTLLAAEKLGRRCRMVELNPRFCDVIIARWEKLTGAEAVRLQA